MASTPDETREGVGLTHLDQDLLEGGPAKRALVDHLDAVSDRLLPLLTGRALSVVRARGRERFMQKNLPKGAPEWIRAVTFYAEGSQRDVHYALADDRRTLLWFANQRAVEYHVPLTLADDPATPTHLVVDLDPPEGADSLAPVVAAARAVREVLRDAGFDPAVKTSGAKGLHVVTPITPADLEDVHAATRAVTARAERLDPNGTTTAFIKADRGGKVFLDPTRAGNATVVAAYSPRVRPGLPVSCPVDWDGLDDVVPAEITVADPDRFLRGPSWTERLGEARPVPADLVEEGHTIPVARVAAMHEGKRRKRAATAD